MTTVPQETLIFADYAGNYYTMSRATVEQYECAGQDNGFVIPRDVLQRARVPEERKAELARLLGEQDVTGYAAAWQGDDGRQLRLLGTLPARAI